MTTAVTLERKVIPIAGAANGKPREFLLLDAVLVNGETMLRGSHWYIRPPMDKRPAPPQVVLDRIAAEGLVPKGAKRDAWVRVAVERDRLEDLCYVIFHDTRHAPATIEHYIRSTRWGETLP